MAGTGRATLAIYRVKARKVAKMTLASAMIVMPLRNIVLVRKPNVSKIFKPKGWVLSSAFRFLKKDIEGVGHL